MSSAGTHLRQFVANWRWPLACLLFISSFRAFAFDHFHIPSESMQPSLQVGDRIIVNKWVYGTQLPFTSTVVDTPWNQEIQRGDIIVFRYPLDPSVDYVKRVIGVPGDLVRVQGQEIWIQGPQDKVAHKVQREQSSVPCRKDAQTETSCALFDESLNGHRYQVRYENIDRASVDIPGGVFRVPPDAFFVLGDNRQRSADSLRWLAAPDGAQSSGNIRRPFVPRGHIKGRVESRYWPL